MDPNFENSTPLATRSEDLEKALLSPHSPPSDYAVYQTTGAEEVLPQHRRLIVRRRRLCYFTACTLLLFLFWHPLVDSEASVSQKVRAHISPHPLTHLAAYTYPFDSTPVRKTCPSTPTGCTRS